MTANPERWPELPYAAWKDTRDTLHLWTQIVGKIRLALTPWLNHSWHVALYVTARGLTTGPMPYGEAAPSRSISISSTTCCRCRRATAMRAGCRCGRCRSRNSTRHGARRCGELGIDVTIDTMPCEIADCIPFDDDDVHKSYDRDYANRFWRVLVAAHEVMSRFRTGFLGKASPVHFFWGSFDLAVTRFSGRRAPRHPGGVPHLPDAVAQEAYSHEVSSAGFWPGGGGPVDYAAFYSYAYPAPDGICRSEGEARRRVFLQGSRRVFVALRCGAERRAIPTRR